jgi:hypothetical protein
MMTGLQVAALVLAASSQDVAKEGNEIQVSKTWSLPQSGLAKAEGLRITKTEPWAEFWKTHADPKSPLPPVDFEKDMVLILPIDLARNEAVVRRTIRVRETDDALRMLLSITTTFLGAQRGNEAPPRVVTLSVAVVPRSAKKVEEYLETGKTDAERPKLLFVLP